MATQITGSVGAGGKNRTIDISAVQMLLNKWVTPNVPLTGVVDENTIRAIKTFQARFTKNPDGRIDPGGATLKRLNREPLVRLPQYSGMGYYSYGKSEWSARQWGTKATIDALLEVSRQFNAEYPNSLVAIGDISLEFGGEMKPHSTHRDGKHVDLRPCRKDNIPLPVNYHNAESYDREKTRFLVKLLLSHRNVKNVLFNDPQINSLDRVSPWSGHDDHLHVTMKD